MVRIAYFGTDGRPGHYAIPIRGKFTERRGKDISSFERQEKESGFNFLHNHNNGRMRSGHIVINGIGMFKQIMKSGT